MSVESVAEIRKIRGSNSRSGKSAKEVESHPWPDGVP